MQFRSTVPMTAMDIRRKEQEMESLLDITDGIQVMIKGNWRGWVNGDEYNEKSVVLPDFVHVKNIGTRYLTVYQGKRRWEVKPDTCLGGWEIIFRPDTPMLRVSNLPVDIQDVYEAVLEWHGDSNGACAAKVESMVPGLPKQRISHCLHQLEEMKLVKMFKVKRRKAYFIR